jgi:hypothetical protein
MVSTNTKSIKLNHIKSLIYKSYIMKIDLSNYNIHVIYLLI